ncbi:MAG: hypothetical protein WCV86_04575 [Patescibacteria group bacterium]|jgi:hypothetical protein
MITQEMLCLLGQHVLQVIASSFFRDTLPRQRLMSWTQSCTFTNDSAAPEISIYLPTSRKQLHREAYARMRIVGLIEALTHMKPNVRFTYLNKEELAALVV